MMKKGKVVTKIKKIFTVQLLLDLIFAQTIEVQIVSRVACTCNATKVSDLMDRGYHMV